MTVSDTPTTTIAPRHHRSWWNHWYSLTVVLGAGWVVWAFGVAWLSDGDTSVLPRYLNSIMLTGLGCGTVITFVAASNQNRRERDTEWQMLVLAAIDDLRQQRDASEPTLDVVAPPHRPQPNVLYASVAAVHDGQVDAIAGALGRCAGDLLARFRDEAATVVREFDARLDGRLSDVQALLDTERELAAVGSRSGSVTPLQPRGRQ
ncbi:hypothetical protein [Phytohabitans houttuyneae]|uniref:Uncharacterized protein n=1 Tax=Phytohabitans houttuyneae TaxID=1076126 RepID=A0A6V8KCD8_9ACTN|nr:hypothetical protein [Phytohabitans houttuyneae]GFJ79397.1 hypothetical protein Phou_035770 [Phytohabitans houttuyneae]